MTTKDENPISKLGAAVVTVGKKIEQLGRVDPITVFNEKFGGTRKGEPMPKAEARQIQGMPIDKIDGVILPQNPPFEKVLALFLFLTFGLRKAWSEVNASFWGGDRVYKNPRGILSGGNRPTEALERRWRQGLTYPIDLGKNKYQMRSCAEVFDPKKPAGGHNASACETVAWDLGLIQKWGLEDLFVATHEWVTGTERGRKRAFAGTVWYRGRAANAHDVVERTVTDVRERIALHYVLLAGRNNGTGLLKHSHCSVVYLMRELCKPATWTPEEREAMKPVDWTMDMVVDWTLAVIDADFRVRVGLAEQTLTLPETAALKANTAYGALFAEEQQAGTDFRHFTLASHLRNLVALGKGEQEVWDEGDSVLVNIVAQSSIQNDKADDLLDGVVVTKFGGGFGVVISHVDPAIANNTRFPRAAFRRYPVRVIVVVNAKGNVSVLTDRTVPIERIARELIRREPRLWFYDPKFGCVLNGGHSYGDTPPTKIPLGEIVEELKRVALEVSRK